MIPLCVKVKTPCVPLLSWHTVALTRFPGRRTCGEPDQYGMALPSGVVGLSPLASGDRKDAGNAFPATMDKITPMGFYQKVQLACGFPLVAYVTNSSFSDLSLKEGAEVLASFNFKAVHVIRSATNERRYFD